jgi:hypothetical protein
MVSKRFWIKIKYLAAPRLPQEQKSKYFGLSLSFVQNAGFITAKEAKIT